MNVTILVGRLTADPELKHTQNGTATCSFSIAVNRAYSKDKEQQADFINIVAWRQTAEFITKYFKKGEKIGIVGSIQTRKWQDKDGNKRTAFEVVANSVEFVESKSSKPQAAAENTSDASDWECLDDGEDLPF
jgi:single-strand DNA-binding protein